MVETSSRHFVDLSILVVSGFLASGEPPISPIGGAFLKDGEPQISLVASCWHRWWYGCSPPVGGFVSGLVGGVPLRGCSPPPVVSLVLLVSSVQK